MWSSGYQISWLKRGWSGLDFAGADAKVEVAVFVLSGSAAWWGKERLVGRLVDAGCGSCVLNEVLGAWLGC